MPLNSKRVLDETTSSAKRSANDSVQNEALLMKEEDGLQKFQSFSDRYRKVCELGYSDEHAQDLVLQLSGDSVKERKDLIEGIFKYHDYFMKIMERQKLFDLTQSESGREKIKNLLSFLEIMLLLRYDKNKIEELFKLNCEAKFSADKFRHAHNSLMLRGFNYEMIVSCFARYRTDREDRHHLTDLASYVPDLSRFFDANEILIILKSKQGLPKLSFLASSARDKSRAGILTVLKKLIIEITFAKPELNLTQFLESIKNHMIENHLDFPPGINPFPIPVTTERERDMRLSSSGLSIFSTIPSAPAEPGGSSDRFLNFYPPSTSPRST
ncbi:MAG: hypothetical protein HY939_01105 [Gammaproteobacteria bacterium]|nr:hypothetical protein [Gammaproteobacteria bacterium]